MHIIANWKMHGDAERVNAWIAALGPTLATLPSSVQVTLCPPSLFVAQAVARAGALTIGAQNCHHEAQGAFTGEISADMLASLGARYVILGHSERRTLMGETPAMVAAKAKAAEAAGLIPVICIGETGVEREEGRTLEIICTQLRESAPPSLKHAVIAYEPVWAIGTGLTPDEGDIATAHEAIDRTAAAHQVTRDIRWPVVYGGSVNSSNAASILALGGVDGALVGGASLDAAQFASVVSAAISCAKQG